MHYSASCGNKTNLETFKWYQLQNKLETVSIAEPLQNRQHAPLMLSTLGSKEKREGGW